MSGRETVQSAETGGTPDVNDDLLAYVRFHGANDVIDAVLTVAVEVYGDVETALPKVHETLLRRASAMSTSPGAPS